MRRFFVTTVLGSRKADRVNDSDSIARACVHPTGSRCERAITGPRESFNFLDESRRRAERNYRD